MIKTYENFISKLFKKKKNFGDIILSDPGNSIYVIGSSDMDLCYNYQSGKFSLSNKVMQKDDDISRQIHKFKRYTLEEFYKIFPDMIVSIYLRMKDDDLSVDSIHNWAGVMNNWKKRIPDLIIHEETNKYNL